MSIHEECGVFGVYSRHRENVGSLTYYGLYALQHRGQESCGIVVNDDGVFVSHKGLGLVSEVFHREALEKLPEGEMAVGHVRYGTTGGLTLANHRRGYAGISALGGSGSPDRWRGVLQRLL